MPRLPLRAPLLAATALIGTLAALPASAACVEGPSGTFTCTGSETTPLIDARDGVSVIVAPGADITSPALAVQLDGDNAAIVNQGTIAATSTANGTYAITGTGDGLTIDNDGTISSGDRGIELLGGPGNMTLTNNGAISSRRQAVRALEGIENVTVFNNGTITATDGRAVQVRGFGATVINNGTMTAGDEGVEGRDGFFMQNNGTITITSGDDGVQYGDGIMINTGTIDAGDDGIDVDSGSIDNFGTIVSRGTASDAAGIDVDAVAESGAPAPTLQIFNWAGGSISGYSGIFYDPASTAEQLIRNEGLIEGTGGAAIAFAPGQGASRLELAGESVLIGDVLFGGADDLVLIEALTSDTLATGDFDGGAGIDTVVFGAGFDMGSLMDAVLSADLLTVTLRNLDGEAVTGAFRNFELFGLGGQTYGAREFAALAAPVPAPATLSLLGVGVLGLGLAAAHRRSA